MDGAERRRGSWWNAGETLASGFAGLLALALCMGCTPKEEGAQTNYAFSTAETGGDLVVAALQGVGTLSVCAEWRDVKNPNKELQEEAHRILKIQEHSIRTWAKAVDASFKFQEPKIAGYGNCGTRGDFSKGKIVVYLFKASRSFERFNTVRYSLDGATNLAAVSPVEGLVLYNLERITHSVAQSLDAVVLHEMGHVFGLLDVYWRDEKGYLMGELPGQPPSVMAGTQRVGRGFLNTLQPDDIAGVREIRERYKTGKDKFEVGTNCGPGYEPYTPAKDGLNPNAVYCTPSKGTPVKEVPAQDAKALKRSK